MKSPALPSCSRTLDRQCPPDLAMPHPWQCGAQLGITAHLENTLGPTCIGLEGLVWVTGTGHEDALSEILSREFTADLEMGRHKHLLGAPLVFVKRSPLSPLAMQRAVWSAFVNARVNGHSKSRVNSLPGNGWVELLVRWLSCYRPEIGLHASSDRRWLTKSF